MSIELETKGGHKQLAAHVTRDLSSRLNGRAHARSGRTAPGKTNVINLLPGVLKANAGAFMH